jgi:GT2 family glycosyltransferase
LRESWTIASTDAASDTPLVSVIVLNYNGKDVLEECIKSILNSNYSRVEVIVIDNGSTDESYMIAKKYEPQVKLIKSPHNLGYSAGNNLGIRVAKGKYIFLVNNDAIIHSDCIYELVKIASSDPRIGILGCKVYYRGTRIIQHAGGKLNLSATAPPHIRVFEEDHGQYDEVSDVDYVSGVAMMIKREVVDKIGLLNEHYFSYWEDVDYCFRAKKAGFRVVYVPKAIVEHFEGFSWKKKSFLQKFLNERNRLLFVLNNFSNKEVAIFLLTDMKNIILRMVEAFRRILLGKSSYEARIVNIYAKEKLTFSVSGIFQWGLALTAAYLWLAMAIFKNYALMKNKNIK